MSSVVILESDKNELNDISRRLEEDGLKTNLSDEHKLRYVWRCLQRAEHSLKSALDDVEKLRRQHAEEMIEVENYVSYIRHLSEEREALTLEFEAENEQLKDEVVQLTKDKNSGNFVCPDTNKLLITHGIPSLVDTPVLNQVSHLLKELKSCEDNMLALQNENTVLKAESDIRVAKVEESFHSAQGELEEEIRQMQENMRAVKQEERRSYDTEVIKLKDERKSLEQELQLSKIKLKDMEDKVDQLNLTISNDRKQHRSNLRDLTKTLENELVNVSELKEKERQKANKKTVELGSLEVEFRQLSAENESVQRQRNDLLKQVETLQAKLAERDIEIGKLEVCKMTLEKERDEKVIERDLQLKELTDKLTGENKLLDQKNSEKIKNFIENQKKFEILLQSRNNQISEQAGQIKTLEKEIQKLEFIIIEKESKVQEIHKNLEQKQNEISVLMHQINDLQSQKTGLQSIVLSQEKNLRDSKQELAAANKQCEEIESKYQLERDQKDALESRLASVTKENTSTQKYLNQLKEEVQSLTIQLTKHQDMSLQEQGKFQDITNNLKIELEKERESKQNETKQLTKTLEEANNSCVILTAQLKESECKAQSLSERLELTSKSVKELSASLEKESNLRVEFENKANSFQEHLTTAQGKLSELTEKVFRLDLSNSQLQKDLDLKSQLVERLDSSLSQQQTEYTAVSVTKETLQSKMEANERQNCALRSEVNVLKECIQKANNDIRSFAGLKSEMKGKNEKIRILKGKLDEHEKTKTFLIETISELQKQTELLELRIEQQESVRGDLEGHLNDKERSLIVLKSKYKQASKLKSDTEDEVKLLNLKMSDIFRENESLKVELFSLSNKFDDLQRKHDEKMVKTKAKFQTLQDRHAREKRAFETLISQLQSNLEIARGRIEYESKWMQSNDSSSKKVEERSELLSRIVRLEESIRDRSIDHKKIIIKNEHLEFENQELRERIESLTKGKQVTEKLELQSSELTLSDSSSDSFPVASRRNSSRIRRSEHNMSPSAVPSNPLLRLSRTGTDNIKLLTEVNLRNFSNESRSPSPDKHISR